MGIGQPSYAMGKGLLLKESTQRMPGFRIINLRILQPTAPSTSAAIRPKGVSHQTLSFTPVISSSSSQLQVLIVFPMWNAHGNPCPGRQSTGCRPSETRLMLGEWKFRLRITRMPTQQLHCKSHSTVRNPLGKAQSVLASHFRYLRCFLAALIFVLSICFSP